VLLLWWWVTALGTWGWSLDWTCPMVFTVWLCAPCQGGWICSAVYCGAPPIPSHQCKYCVQTRSTSLNLTMLVKGSQNVRCFRTPTNIFQLKTYWAKCSCVCVCVCECEVLLFLGWSAAVPYAREVLLLLCVLLCLVRTIHICDFRLVINWTPDRWQSLHSDKCSDIDLHFWRDLYVLFTSSPERSD